MPIKLLGDETQLLSVKAAPQKFLSAPFVITGGVEIDDYYNYGYSNKSGTYQSLSFIEAVSPTKLGERAHLYLVRGRGDSIIDTITKDSIELSKQTSEKSPIRIRVRAALNPYAFNGDSWNMFDLLDAQFWVPEKNDWGLWAIADRKKLEQQQRDESAKRKSTALAQAKSIREKNAQQDRAERTRTWNDAAGKFSVVAEFSGMASNDVLLKKEDGKTIKVPLDKLCDADREWVQSRIKKSAK